MIPTTIIGLTGPKGCGKDTVAQLLATHARFSRLAFADALRAEVSEAFAVEGIALTRRDLKEQPVPHLAIERCTDQGFIGAIVKYLNALDPACDLMAEIKEPRSPRQIMQWWGTQYRRNTARPDYWTSIVVSRIATQQRGGQYRHVISDVRFANEADAIRSMGGVIWQIQRPELKLDTSHVSEVDGSAFAPDAVITNSHNLRHLQGIVLAEWVKADNSMTDDDLANMHHARQAAALL